ncbi:carbohydrate-binding family 9-like protein [Hymenobacter sp. GOD-10R]|uniref:carbohydrate-binding family 9-like protein n=1 Tax=Hymenobacter sp. GOD-10R TaxID=3093922 RepID=UPI002D79A12A|nr:carbohydrate-binding family 9-like protein [Hymenobacter sp. GOD-10R]WRQ30275.1 carbohydrate-binding family 9-like protein [Hymenobacter sp. GOD-10R]
MKTNNNLFRLPQTMAKRKRRQEHSITNTAAKRLGRWASLLCFVALASPLQAQTAFQGMEALFTPPKGYVVQHTSQPLAMDGNLQESDWQKAAWTSNFVDIEGAAKPLPTFQTRVKMLWNDSTLFIAATMQEPQIWATQTHHDDIIYKDNDFEVFIDPDDNTHQYFEIEVNALNKIFDLFLPKPYRNKGDALIGWDVAGLQSGVSIDGTLNQPQDQDKSWTVEMAIPLKALRMGFPFQAPTEGTLWRINFSRVEWDTKVVGDKNPKLKDAAGKDLPEHNWVWSPQGVINMHYPERWGYLQFTRQANTTFQLPPAELRKRYLWLVYYRQQQYREKAGRYAATLAELKITPQVEVDKQANQLQLAATPYQFTATLTAVGKATIRINDEGLLETLKP